MLGVRSYSGFQIDELHHHLPTVVYQHENSCRCFERGARHKRILVQGEKVFDY